MQLLSTWGTVNLLNTADFVTTTQYKNVLLIFALVCVTATKRNMSVILGFSGVKKISTRDKTVVCTFWCEVSVYYIRKHLYFSCENVDIYENVNIGSMELASPVLWKLKRKYLPGRRSLKVKRLGGRSECNF